MEQARDAEVEQLELLELAARQEQVRRLDVAVHDPALVEHGETLAGAPRDRERLVERQTGAREALTEVLAFEPLHRDVGTASLGDAVRDVLHDPRVAHLGEDLRLAAEALGVARRRMQDLDGDRAAGESIASAKDLAHSARADQLLDLETVCDDLVADHSPRVVASRPFSMDFSRRTTIRRTRSRSSAKTAWPVSATTSSSAPGISRARTSALRSGMSTSCAPATTTAGQRSVRRRRVTRWVDAAKR